MANTKQNCTSGLPEINLKNYQILALNNKLSLNTMWQFLLKEAANKIGLRISHI